ncbi:hypothetical protein [Streptomyces sp. t39]|uniref:hypothetical protein n=1 Tax=Streptomyces sp. t39 TaxID=1828156 RepID=UPI0011CE130D|nr:hypothetical protein [Streptomyces sp. t39]TXS56673.1 hypothetical protein EAO77_11575 [Streptomyces sp. t39]
MTRYDHPGAPARYDDGRGAGFLALTKAWAAGIVVLLFTEYVQVTLVWEQFGTEDRTASFAGRLLLIHLPNALCVALAVWAAGRLHRPPYRHRTVRHLLAVLAVPLAAQALNLTLQGPELAAEGVLMSSAVLALGCVAGWAADRLQEED